jgi:hypothetical protein
VITIVAEIDNESKARLEQSLRLYPHRALRAAVRALNRGLDKARTSVGRIFSRGTGLRSGRIRKRLKQQRATIANLLATLTLSGKAIPAHWFKNLRWTKAEGVTFRVLDQKIREPSGFIRAPRDVRIALKRKGRKRYPLTMITGPSLADMARRMPEIAQLRIDVRRTVRDRLNHELSRIRSGARE